MSFPTKRTAFYFFTFTNFIELANFTLKSRGPILRKLLGIGTMPYGLKTDRWYRYYSLSNMTCFRVSLVALKLLISLPLVCYNFGSFD